ncbi:MAG: LemA family protein [Pseudomonadota bacterium]
MGDSVIVWFVMAVLLFWAMGAYNRLVRLRSRGILAFAVLEGLFNQYLLIVNTNSPPADQLSTAQDSDQDQDAISVAWRGLVAAAEQFNASLKVSHAQPLNGPTTQALRTAWETLSLSWLRLGDLPPDLAGPALPNQLQSQWEHLSLQTEIARTEFNRRIENYNEAIHQFPALLLAWVFGFKPAQPI